MRARLPHIDAQVVPAVLVLAPAVLADPVPAPVVPGDADPAPVIPVVPADPVPANPVPTDAVPAPVVPGDADPAAREPTTPRLAGRVRGNRLVRWGEQRLEQHASGRFGSLVLGCLRRSAESSRNSGSALVLNVFLATVPALLAVYALADRASTKIDSVAHHLVVHLNLHAGTASLVLGAFGTVAHNAAAASVFGLVSFLIFGLAVGKVLQDVYVRAWRVHVGSLKDQWRFAVWFIVSTTLLGLQVSEEAVASSLGWELLVPVWLAVLVAFWLWTPWFLLHRQIELRRHLPGALLTAVTYTLAVTVSQFVLGSWINENAHFFGSFGIAVALLCWGEVLAGIWLGGAVFSPVYAEWRAGWKRDGASPFTYRERTSRQAEN